MSDNSLHIKDSPIHGKGLFTSIPRKSGEVLGVALDKVSNTNDPDQDYKQTEIGKHINHSDDPNVKVIQLADGNLGIAASEDIDSNEEITADYNQFSELMNFTLSKRAKSRYIEKKKEESGNITYIYSPKHVEKRNKAKAKRVQQLSKSISKVRRQVKGDLSATDLNERYTALAVALIDETYERIGNDESAKEMGHFGVTTWKVKHVKFNSGKATISYIGKSGVKQKKQVSNKASVKLLKELTKGKAKNDKLFVGEDYFITANKVNKYLHRFDITAKDIRGFHANDEMRASLKKVRSKGGKLPEPGKERESKLKKEFKEALEETAKLVGHKASTLKNQYLVPGMFAAYTEKGTILKDLAKSAALNKEEFGFIKQCSKELNSTISYEEDDDLFIIEANRDFRKLLSLISRSYRKNNLSSPLLDSVKLLCQPEQIHDIVEFSGFPISIRASLLDKPSEEEIADAHPKEEKGANCFFHAAILALKYPELTLIKGRHSMQNPEDTAHFWLEDEDENIIDPTAYQYPPGKYIKEEVVDVLKNLDAIKNNPLFEELPQDDKDLINSQIHEAIEIFLLSKRAATPQEEEVTHLYRILGKFIIQSGGFKILDRETKAIIKETIHHLKHNNPVYAKKLLLTLIQASTDQLSKQASEESHLYQILEKFINQSGELSQEMQDKVEETLVALYDGDSLKAKKLLINLITSIKLDTLRASFHISKRAEKHEGAMLAIMAPPALVKKMNKNKMIDKDTVSSDGIHITLLYLGKAKELNKTTIDAIEKAAKKVCEKHPPLEMRIAGAGLFIPEENKTPVFVVPNAKGLSALQADLENAISNIIDLPSEHGWVPHMTVSYSCEDNPELPELNEEFTWTANKVRFQVGGKKIADISLKFPISKRAALDLRKIFNIQFFASMKNPEMPWHIQWFEPNHVSAKFYPAPLNPKAVFNAQIYEDKVIIIFGWPEDVYVNSNFLSPLQKGVYNSFLFSKAIPQDELLSNVPAIEDAMARLTLAMEEAPTEYSPLQTLFPKTLFTGWQAFEYSQNYIHAASPDWNFVARLYEPKINATLSYRPFHQDLKKRNNYVSREGLPTDPVFYKMKQIIHSINEKSLSKKQTAHEDYIKKPTQNKESLPK